MDRRLQWLGPCGVYEMMRGCRRRCCLGELRKKRTYHGAKKVEGPVVKRLAGDRFEGRLVPSLSRQNRVASVMSRRSG